jgi:hypothetical protein
VIPSRLFSQEGFRIPSGSKRRGRRYSMRSVPVAFWRIAESM